MHLHTYTYICNIHIYEYAYTHIHDFIGMTDFWCLKHKLRSNLIVKSSSLFNNLRSLQTFFNINYIIFIVMLEISNRIYNISLPSLFYNVLSSGLVFCLWSHSNGRLIEKDWEEFLPARVPQVFIEELPSILKCFISFAGYVILDFLDERFGLAFPIWYNVTSFRFSYVSKGPFCQQKSIRICPFV